MVNLLLSILSAAILSVAFSSTNNWWLAPIAIASHIFWLQKSSHPFINSFVFGSVFNAIALTWTNIYVGSTPWIILSIGQGLLFLPLGFVKKYGAAFYPLIFLLLEELRSLFPFGGFGWLRLAYSAAGSPYSQFAAVGGVAGLSALTLCIALVIFWFFCARFNLLPLLPLALLLIPINTNVVGSVKVLMVQGNVGQLGLDFNARAREVFSNHVEESKKALKTSNDVDFILWPENAVDVDPFTDSLVRADLDSFDQPLIVGAVIGSDGSLQNTSILWRKTSQEIYVKQHLTPFGEYIPLRGLAEKISPLTDRVKDFSAGTSLKIFDIDNAKVAPVICFELIDDSLVKSAARASNLIVVQTNNATFGRSVQSSQQLAMTRIRAIEYGRNILSVSTTGVSAFISTKGELEMATDRFQSAHLFAEPELITGQTPRDKLGDWALAGALIWLLILGSTPGGRSRIRR